MGTWIDEFDTSVFEPLYNFRLFPVSGEWILGDVCFPRAVCALCVLKEGVDAWWNLHNALVTAVVVCALLPANLEREGVQGLGKKKKKDDSQEEYTHTA